MKIKQLAGKVFLDNVKRSPSQKACLKIGYGLTALLIALVVVFSIMG